MPISALQVTGISPSESRSCDYISSPCVEQRCTFFYFYMASSIHDDDDGILYDQIEMKYIELN